MVIKCPDLISVKPKGYIKVLLAELPGLFLQIKPE